MYLLLNRFTKYPFIILINCSYGAPDTQLVTESWKIDWLIYLVTKHNWISVSIDGRGSGFQGSKHKHSVYYHLGILEVDDQLTVIK